MEKQKRTGCKASGSMFEVCFEEGRDTQNICG